jgi:hypothetical protein
VNTLTYRGTLVTTTCWCGIPHAIPQELYDYVDQQHRDGRKQTGIYCPLGHSWIFDGESETDRLRRELERRARAHEATRDLLEHEQRSHAATRGHLTRTKRRVAAGVCPCCQRTFKQLERHMKAKHPGYVASAGEGSP